ncbi:phosphatidylinositol-specific phospholipase C1-like protein [Altererythrobacter sp. CC-YST694]|uniref:phosphatidylinositol-specific phospholipase C1-like protein n=1 Tax=Altererythrobacter sp. CC-YST694 TaxID=2755038 RepID=UPI001D01AD9C|nr:phosphatidylinositol-specific phospholipase C1-like protein [Altererythrobacter sp. CC-YST694]
MACCILSGPVWGQPSSCDLTAPEIEDAGPGCLRVWVDHNLRLNDIVAVGTHNSYKVELPEQILAMLRASAPESAEELDYRHRPLMEQLDAGARQLEIDVYNDPQGGRFIAPAGLRAAGIPVDAARLAALAEPGFKVMHVQDIDVLSSCVSWRVCLGIVRSWSLARPDHAPILIMVNAKTDRAALPGGVDALPFDTAAFDALDQDVRDVFPPEALITPDDVQGSYPTLREAVLNNGWPSLGTARGRVMFALDEAAAKVAIYRGNRRSLEGRVFFVNTDEASPAAAYLTLNDPILEGDRIRKAVAAGFIVRTRADAGTHEARAGDFRRRDAALASGAQFISTDYLWLDPRLHNDYRVRLPGNAAALCNPLRTASRCAGVAVEPAAGDKQY